MLGHLGEESRLALVVPVGLLHAAPPVAGAVEAAAGPVRALLLRGRVRRRFQALANFEFRREKLTDILSDQSPTSVGDHHPGIVLDLHADPINRPAE
jgi:hypothetical protein